jgi:3-hydroxyacyl-CoA dehydrogenase
LIGRSWAIAFARSGRAVKLFDSSFAQLNAAQKAIKVEIRSDHGQSTDGISDEIGERIQYVQGSPDSLAEVEWIQECTPEALAMKLECFSELDRCAPPDAIIASSTSSHVPSSFTANLPGKARCLVAHPLNPPHRIRVVELCGSPWTSNEVMYRAEAFMSSIGQIPVVLRREIDGFVFNRLQGALMAEALRLVGDGVACPEDVDEAVRNGLGLRWSLMGPFETMELNAPDGIVDYAARYGSFYARLAADPPNPNVWSAQYISKIESKRFDKSSRQARTRWRDERLLELLQLKSKAPDY